MAVTKILAKSMRLDKLINYIRYWQAGGESEKTSLRVRTRLQQLVEEGYYTGGCAPFGYRLVNSGIVNKKGKELLKLEQELWWQGTFHPTALLQVFRRE